MIQVHPNDYLDTRLPAWESLEYLGLIRYDREIGERLPMVFIDCPMVEAYFPPVAVEAPAHEEETPVAQEN